MHIPTLVFRIVFASTVVHALNVTIDNTSPLVVFSPTPCFPGSPPGCTAEWLLSESTDAYNGSTTSTSGPDGALGLTVVPRASLVFQGSSVVFVPGQHSTAQATVVIDSRSSILVNTSLDAFSGTGLDPATNHTITVTFVPADDPTTLHVDYFVVEQPNSSITSSTALSTTLAPTPLPTSIPPTTTLTLTYSHPHPSHSNSDTQLSSPHTIPSGTIAAVTASGVALALLASFAWLCAARRRRRRAALQREKAILYDLRLPSERGGGVKERRASRVRRWGEEQRERERQRERGEREGETQRESQDPEPEDLPWIGTRRREKGKGRERTWRDSILPPVHYTPWR